MSISPFSGSAKLSERLNAAKTRELASLILKSDLPHPSKDLIAPLLELVGDSAVLVSRGESGLRDLSTFDFANL